jgi:hypothetical protein
VTLIVEYPAEPIGTIRCVGFASRKKPGAVTSTMIVVELVTLPGLVVPLTSIEYPPAVVDGVVELVVIVSVEVAVSPEIKVTESGIRETVGAVEPGIILEVESVSVTVESVSPCRDSIVIMTVSDEPSGMVTKYFVGRNAKFCGRNVDRDCAVMEEGCRSRCVDIKSMIPGCNG